MKSGSMAQVAQHLPNKHSALNSNPPSTALKNKKKLYLLETSCNLVMLYCFIRNMTCLWNQTYLTLRFSCNIHWTLNFQFSHLEIRFNKAYPIEVKIQWDIRHLARSSDPELYIESFYWHTKLYILYLFKLQFWL
jgi:hypothetical protein